MSKDSAIKHFTYDWLIRFAELYPFQPYDSDKNPVGAFNPLMSQHAAISPMFASLMTRYMPYLYYRDQIHIRIRQTAEIEGPPPDVEQRFEMILPKKYSIYICGLCHVLDLSPGLFTWFKKNRIIFYGEQLWMTKSGATFVNLPPDTPRYVLQQLHSYCITATRTTLTEPVAFSEICPFIAHCKNINVAIQITYDSDFTNVARKNRFAPDRFHTFERMQDMSDNVMLEIVDYILSLPNRSSDWEFSFSQNKPISLIKVVVDKIVAAGFKKRYGVASRTPFILIQVCISKETGTYDCSFLPSMLAENDSLSSL